MTVPYYQDSHCTIFHGDCREILPQIDAASVHCCVTSPPYFGLRDYQGEHQIGLEATPAAYVAEMTGVFEEVRRVLRRDGTTWLNLGDSYANNPSTSAIPRTEQGNGSGVFRIPDEKHVQARRQDANRLTAMKQGGLKHKDLIGIPWRVAFALQEAGWWLRSDIIWSKGNPMPESVTDRPTKAHEYLFLLAKAERYYYDADAIRETYSPITTDTTQRRRMIAEGKFSSEQEFRGSYTGKRGGVGERMLKLNDSGRNRRSVWTINTQPYAGAHFAVFPEKLIEPCILAGCPAQVCAVCGAPWVRVVEREPFDKEGWGAATKDHHGPVQGAQSMIRNGNGRAGSVHVTTLGWHPSCPCNAATIPGTVLDCFGGSGTTARVAKRLGRKSILIDQSEQYCEMAAASLVQQAFTLEVFA